jgi:hypothetical protein
MENASKALLMAGGVLIGILILSLAVYLFVSFGGTAAQVNDQNAQVQLTQFNSKFTIYEGKSSNTVYDIITVAGYARENNIYYDNDDKYYITVSVNGITTVYNDLGRNIVDIKKGLIDEYYEYTFDCKVEYSSKTGRVNRVTFKKNN